MMVVRKSADRGHADHGWLKSHHTFSFADYYDPKFMHFRDLRVINEDFIAGGEGFPTHGHKDMEIITYIIDGMLEHKDSMGNTATISPGEVQRMSAGTGVRHSEYNHLKDRETHLLQIWILPEKNDVQPGYGQKNFSQALEEKGLVLVVSKDGREGSITMNQAADVYAGKLKAGDKREFSLRSGRHAWIQIAKGELAVNGISLKQGDGVAISDESILKVESKGSDFILFDLA